MVPKILRVKYGKARELVIRLSFNHKEKRVVIRGVWVDQYKNGKVHKTNEYELFLNSCCPLSGLSEDGGNKIPEFSGKMN